LHQLLCGDDAVIAWVVWHYLSRLFLLFLAGLHVTSSSVATFVLLLASFFCFVTFGCRSSVVFVTARRPLEAITARVVNDYSAIVVSRLRRLLCVNDTIVFQVACRRLSCLFLLPLVIHRVVSLSVVTLVLFLVSFFCFVVFRRRSSMVFIRVLRPLKAITGRVVVLVAVLVRTSG
jgi:hypothetical protein